jgi:hypothetical protein
MTILTELLRDLKNKDDVEQIRTICDQIKDEESKNIKHSALMPKGPNIFLCLEVPGRTQKEYAFLTLEREPTQEYVARLWSVDIKRANETPPPLRVSWAEQIKEDKPKRVLMEYARLYKFYKGA